MVDLCIASAQLLLSFHRQQSGHCFCFCNVPVGAISLLRRCVGLLYLFPCSRQIWIAGAHKLVNCAFRETLEQCRAHGIDEVMRATIMDPIPINYGPWLSMSEEGLTFLQCLMLRNPAKRISAADALSHPWFAQQFAQAGLTPNPSCSRHEAAANAPEALNSLPLDHRNNIVPMPQQQQQQQQQHQHRQSQASLQSNQYILSL